MKDKLLKTIEKAYHSTKNSAKKITLANYYNTVQEQDEASIDHEWYYKQLKISRLWERKTMQKRFVESTTW